MTWVTEWPGGSSRHATEDEALEAADRAVRAGAENAVTWEADGLHRAVWNDPGCWWPSHRDFPTPTAAHAFAIEKSRAINAEVDVYDLTHLTTAGGTR